MNNPAARIVITMGIIISLTCMAMAYKVNDKIEVQWNGKWYKATILQVEDGKYLIHYEGYASSWDEWIGDDRIKADYAAGDIVQVLWNGKWFKAEILKAENGKYLIHYDGYDSSWDEWVDKDRIKK